MPSSLIPASTACEAGKVPRHDVVDTCTLMIREKIPNLFRLFLNPYVVQTCYCLSEYVRTTWEDPSSAEPRRQSFLANSFDEALSGAVKLARYCSNLEQRSPTGLVLDPENRLGPFASLTLQGGGKIDFIPELVVAGAQCSSLHEMLRAVERCGFVVVAGAPLQHWAGYVDLLQDFLRKHAPMVIVCVDRRGLFACRQGKALLPRGVVPDIVVFDESFVDRQVPFAAFTARKALYQRWNKIARGAFHSTTYQPNTIASLQFIKCLQQADPEFHAQVEDDLERIRRDPRLCTALLGSLYSPVLARTIRALGFDTGRLQASGHYVIANGRKIFDGVAGVACSIRGHNSPAYAEEIKGLDDVEDVHGLLSERLRELTGLEHLAPAVSGASAVENALRIGLAAQFPRRVVLALKGGFGGKTLLALAGTAKDSYKANLDPLYEHVIYIDPFAADVLENLEATFNKYPVAIVQLELIQAVGGVRPIPIEVLRYLQEHKERFGYLLFVDEVQTGMYRTGPFILARPLGMAPDLLTIGKGTSDMMFPFALTLYSGAVRQQLQKRTPELAETIRQRHAYDVGYKTVLNVLDWARRTAVDEKVAATGVLFARCLSERLASCKAVREVRVHGLLIAIELQTAGRIRRILAKRLSSCYLWNMARARSFPVLIGFCQYEPHVLKLTPPLSITPDEVVQVCDTIAAVLKKRVYKLLPRLVWSLARASVRGRRRPGKL